MSPPELPLGPETEVTEAFEDRKPTVDHVAGVTPALHMVYRWYSWWRDEREQQIRAEEERLRREEEEEQQRQEAQRLAIERAQAAERERLAQQALQRRLEQESRGRRRAHNRSAGDRAEAERVLAEAGAELLDWTAGRSASQAVVTFRFLGRRFRSVVRVPGLRVVEAGICLTDARSGERGDDRFTLASLPAVIAQAERQKQLVILRW